MSHVHQYVGLRVALSAGESLVIKIPGRNLFTITMDAGEETVTMRTIQSIQNEVGSDLGNTGWSPDSLPTEADRAREAGVDHDIRPSPMSDIRGGTQ